MSEYREEVVKAVIGVGPAWNAIREWHEFLLTDTPRTLETLRHGTSLIADVDSALTSLIELGVRLGLEAAAKNMDAVAKDAELRSERHTALAAAAEIRAIDAAAVLRKP